MVKHGGPSLGSVQSRLFSIRVENGMCSCVSSEDLMSRVSFCLASLGWLHLFVSTSSLPLERVKLTLGSSEGVEFST